MRNPIPAARRAMRWAAWWLRWMIECLRRREGSLSFHAEQGGFYARQAEALAAALGCILTDHLLCRARHNEGEITAARSRGSNLGLSSIRARLPESGDLDFQAAIGAEQSELGADKGPVEGVPEV